MFALLLLGLGLTLAYLGYRTLSPKQPPRQTPALTEQDSPLSDTTAAPVHQPRTPTTRVDTADSKSPPPQDGGCATPDRATVYRTLKQIDNEGVRIWRARHAFYKQRQTDMGPVNANTLDPAAQRELSDFSLHYAAMRARMAELARGLITGKARIVREQDTVLYEMDGAEQPQPKFRSSFEFEREINLNPQDGAGPILIDSLDKRYPQHDHDIVFLPAVDEPWSIVPVQAGQGATLFDGEAAKVSAYDMSTYGVNALLLRNDVSSTPARIFGSTYSFWTEFDEPPEITQVDIYVSAAYAAPSSAPRATYRIYRIHEPESRGPQTDVACPFSPQAISLAWDKGQKRLVPRTPPTPGWHCSLILERQELLPGMFVVFTQLPFPEALSIDNL